MKSPDYLVLNPMHVTYDYLPKRQKLVMYDGDKPVVLYVMHFIFSYEKILNLF